jgi:hypothetical protein
MITSEYTHAAISIDVEEVPCLIRRPSREIMDALCHHRTPVNDIHTALDMHPHIWQKTRVSGTEKLLSVGLFGSQKIFGDLVLRHLDVSLGYFEQPRAQLEFFKRKVIHISFHFCRCPC